MPHGPVPLRVPEPRGCGEETQKVGLQVLHPLLQSLALNYFITAILLLSLSEKMTPFPNMLQITLTDNLKFETIPEVLNQGLWVLFKDL